MPRIQPWVAGCGRWRALGWTGIVAGVLLPVALLHSVAVTVGGSVDDTMPSSALVADATPSTNAADDASPLPEDGCQRVVSQPLYDGLSKWVTTVVWDCSAAG